MANKNPKMKYALFVVKKGHHYTIIDAESGQSFGYFYTQDAAFKYADIELAERAALKDRALIMEGVPL